MSATSIAGGEPEYRGGLLTQSEYALAEAGAISGRASVWNALLRNGYEGLAGIEDTAAFRAVRIPVTAPMEEEPAPDASLTTWWLEGLAIATITLVWGWVLLRFLAWLWKTV